MSLPARMPAWAWRTPEWGARGSVAATHLGYDSVPRTPRERAAMLQRIGISRVVWDWREDSVGALASQMDAFRAAGIALEGLWAPVPLPEPAAPDYDSRFGEVPPLTLALMREAALRGLSPDLWTPLAYGPPGPPPEISDREHAVEVTRAADHLAPLATAAQDFGMGLVLANHGGWGGEPRTMVDVVTALGARGLRNVGVALQLQHGHHLVPELDRHLATLGDNVVAVVLSGVDAGAQLSGRLVLPFGAGSRDRWTLHALLDSAWSGRVLVHAMGDDDAEARLLDSVEGLEWMLGRMAGGRDPRPVPRIVEPTWPPGWAWGTTGEGRPTRQGPDGALTSPPTPEVGTAFFAAVHGSETRDAGPHITPLATPRYEDLEVLDTPPGGLSRRERRAYREAVARSEGIPVEALEAAVAAARVAAGWVQGAHEHESGRPEESTDETSPWNTAATEAIPVSERLTSAEPSRDETSLGDAQHPTPASGIETPPGDVTPEPTPASGTRRLGGHEVRLQAPDPYTGALHALLMHLESVGFRGAPRSFGWDDAGRHLVEYVPGIRADSGRAPDRALDPTRIGAFLRDMHDALESFEPPADAQWFAGLPAPGDDLIVHQDIAPSNIVIREDGSLVAIDWDAAAPGTRLWDLAHAAHSFAPLYSADTDLADAAGRLRALIDGYRLDAAGREELLPLLAMRSERMYEYLADMVGTGESPWIELWDRGVGAVWHRDAVWIRAHEADWRRALLGGPHMR
ncbi:phosphotransferase [Demequina sp. NBRC 110052]|uniref:phosphotransferase n=1 Tax=Demequina sp. NBRC 110052 TaxID=1570341 RepID=UPI000A06CE6B|nr:phosphotransferase [Demequina sp. NBRC 110052]